MRRRAVADFLKRLVEVYDEDRFGDDGPAPTTCPETVEVPVKATPAMHDAAWAACENGMRQGKDWPAFNQKLWAAMLAARPLAASPAALDAGVEEQRLRFAVDLAKAPG